MSTQRDDRGRGVLEVLTAILLGLVSVATAIGAYQAGEWNQRSAELASVSQQMRDRNLAIFLESQNTTRADGQRIFDALALQAEGVFYPERLEETQREQEALVGAGSPAFIEEWEQWKEQGFNGRTPLNTATYEAQAYAPGQSFNLISEVAWRASEALEDRAFTMTVVSIIFAAALLLLGVSGASSRLAVSAITTAGGMLAFLVGLAVVIFGVF